MNGVVVEVAGCDESSPCREPNDGVVAIFLVAAMRGRFFEEVNDGIGVLKIGGWRPHDGEDRLSLCIGIHS